MAVIANTMKSVLLSVLVAFLAACGGGGGSGGDSNGGGLGTGKAIQELRISPENSRIPLHATVTFQARAIYQDGSSADITRSVAWESGDPALAAFDPGSPNTLITKAEGVVPVTAKMGNVSGATQLTITSPELMSITLSTNTVTLAPGETESIRATGHYQGNLATDVTDQMSWASANDAIATVGSTGVVTAIAHGATDITASLDGINAQAAVTVAGAALTSLTVTSAQPSVLQGTISQLTATAGYADASSADVTSKAAWSASDASMASVSSTGLLSALAPGSVTISAGYGIHNADTVVEIVSAPELPGALTLQAIPNVILDNGTDTAQLRATVQANDPAAIIADGTPVTFTPDSTGLAFDSPGGTTVAGQVEGEVTSTTPGHYTIIAEVPATIAIDEVSVRVVPSFAEVIGATGIAIIRGGGGQALPGSEFTAMITNTSNRPFNIHKVNFTNGSTLLNSSPDSSLWGGPTLEPGERAAVTVALGAPQPINGFAISFEMSDTPSGTEFTVTKTF